MFMKQLLLCFGPTLAASTSSCANRLKHPKKQAKQPHSFWKWGNGCATSHSRAFSPFRALGMSLCVRPLQLTSTIPPVYFDLLGFSKLHHNLPWQNISRVALAWNPFRCKLEDRTLLQLGRWCSSSCHYLCLLTNSWERHLALPHCQ